MTERRLRGLGASGGVAVGRALLWLDRDDATDGDGGPEAQAEAAAALARVAEELAAAAERMRAAGLADEAEILEANRLMAEDPTLAADVAARAAGSPAAIALREATEQQARILADLPDPLLAARATDVRELGRRAARLVAGVAPREVADESVLLSRDLGPADVADVQASGGRIRGIALAEGAVTSHAAIMARSLGLPMAVGLGEALLETADGAELVLEGDQGTLVVAPQAATRKDALEAVRRHARRRDRLALGRDLPAQTVDGRRITLLCNAGRVEDVTAGLHAGAEGVGLLRTELAFLEADDWPSEEEHYAALAPVLAPLERRTATVRTLDFGADKTPPFLAGTDQRGIALLLAHPAALQAQLRAVAAAGAETDLRVLLPLVGSADDVRAVRSFLGDPERAPALGAMIETPAAALRADEIAREADFLSIGTNDLVQFTLGLDRGRPLASAEAAADPRILELIEHVVRAARAGGVSVEVCGEAAGEPRVAALLVGLGVDELSVSPARVDEVRMTVRGLDFAEASAAVRTAIASRSLDRALALGAGLLSGEAGYDRGEPVDSLGGVGA
jgi:phosphoenolpyruvate-protein phosphotransferase